MESERLFILRFTNSLDLTDSYFKIRRVANEESLLWRFWLLLGIGSELQSLILMTGITMVRSIKEMFPSTKFLMHRSVVVGLTFIVVLLSSNSFAAIFLPEVNELQPSRTGENYLDEAAISQLASDSQENADFVQVDDMRFKTNELVKNSGFYGTKWTGGDVYYSFDPAVTSADQTKWLDAAAEWSAVANLRFIPRSTQSHYIYVQNDNGNWSYIGMIGGRQEMGIYNWDYKFIIAHEIGHALGLVHEHSRIDRNNYVTILYQNIQTGTENNFEVMGATNYGAYDFDSVMHYAKDTFSNGNGNTIEPRPPYSQWLDLIGQHTHLSDIDKSGMAQRYPGSSTQPDLVVESPAVDDSTLTSGQSFTASATIRNQGNWIAPGTILRYYRSSDATISTDDTEIAFNGVPSLSANATSALNAPVAAPVSNGTYWIGACVDPVSNESNTNNNCSSGVEITVSNITSPDLIVQSPAVDDSSLTPGQLFTISATVKNQGTGSSSSTNLHYYRSSDATISIEDTQLAIDIVLGLPVDGTSPQNASINAPSAGTYWIGACVDPLINESDTTNNCSSGVQITVSNPMYPDLIVQSPGVSDSSLTPGQSFTASATVRNQGNGSSAGTTLHYYRSSDSIISTDDTQIAFNGVPVLSVNATSASSASVAAPISAGTYWIGACVDVVNNESNTGNNCSSGVQVTVSNITYPDLVVLSPSVSDSSLTPEQSFTVGVTVRNQGDGSSSSTTLRYYRSTDPSISTDDTQISTSGVLALPANGTSDETSVVTAPVTPGTYWVGACVDSVSNESNTTNNCSIGGQIVVSEGPNGSQTLAPIMLLLLLDE